MTSPGGPLRLALSAASAFALCVGVAHGQDFKRVVPKLPDQPETPQITVPPEAPPAAQDTTVLIPQLNGVVFVGGLDRLRTGGVGTEAAPGGVAAPDLPPLTDPAFTARIKPYLGRPLTRADLDAIVHLVRDAYRASGRPFMDVGAPPQNVQSGVLQVVVTEYRVGEVSVAGNKAFSSGLIKRLGGLESGDILTLPRMRDALDDYNQNPFLTVNAVLKPGTETGTTDVALQAQEQRPFRVYAGYDNQGVHTLGRDEWNVGFNWGNVFGTGQILSYQFTRSFSGRYQSHSVSDVIPLFDGDKILLFGAYATQVPEISEYFNSEGHSGQASFRYVHKLPGTATVKQSVQVGFDYKRVDSNLEFAGFEIFDSAIEIAQFPVVYDLAVSDRYGRTDVENLLVYSPGGLTTHNTDEAMNQLVPGSDSTYVYDRITATRTTYLPHDVTWIVRALGQIASDNLPYSEELAAGGLGSVRAYDTNIALGSQGVMFSSEFRAPAFSPLRLLKLHSPVEDQMQFGVFYDYGYLTQKTSFPDLPDDLTLSSIGFNVHYNFGQMFNLQLEVGHQLRRSPDTGEHDTKVAIVTSVAF